MIEESKKNNDLKPFVRLKIEYGIGLDGIVPLAGAPACYQVVKSRNLDSYF